MPFAVNTWAALMLSAKPDASQLLPAVRETGSVLRAPATQEELEAVEFRLGLHLPPSYRAFLTVSNGAYASPWGLVTAQEAGAHRHSSVPGLGFLACHDLQPLSVVFPDALRLYSPAPTSRLPPLEVAPERGLLITSELNHAFAALIDVGSAEWEMWLFTRDDVARHASFGRWIFDAISPPADDEVMELIAKSRARDPAALERLYKLRDPAAVPILVAALDELGESVSVRAACLTLLGNLGGEDVVSVLESWAVGDSRSEAIRALTAQGSPSARDALARLGAHGELADLGDERAGEIALAAVKDGDLRAVGTLGRLKDPAYQPALIAIYEQANRPQFQLAVATALLACGSARGRSLLQDLADNPSFRFNQQARAILAEHDRPSAR